MTEFDVAAAVAALAHVDVVNEAEPAAFLNGLVTAIVRERGLAIDLGSLQLASFVDAMAPTEPTERTERTAVTVTGLVRSWPPGVDVVDLVGQVHEAVLGLDHRYALGVYYTPADIAAQVVGLVGESLTAPSESASPPRVCDPAMGGGAFLLAAARELEARGWSRRVIVEEALWGVDIDPVAVAVAEAALLLWAAETGEVPARTNLVEADTLLQGRERLTERRGAGAGADRGFDAVVGNPPFQSQLGASTARTPAMFEKLRERFGAAAYRYTDTAALFLLEACRWTRPGGHVALVLPQSVLVADDAREVRDAVAGLGDIAHLWFAGEAVFSVPVRVCVPVIRVHDVAASDRPESRPISRSRARAFTPIDPVPVAMARIRTSPTWGNLLADLLGAPPVALGGRDTLASFCRATAGFRDQYYGLTAVVREATEAEVSAARLRVRTAPAPPTDAMAPPADRPSSTDRPPSARTALLVTSGLVDPARCRWGRHPTKFDRRSWQAPVVDLDLLATGNPPLAAWTADRLVPKVLVATQTRVIEAAVDMHGDWYPSVPTIAITAAPDAGDRFGPDQLWFAAAVVLSPPISAWAMGRHAGAALSSDAIKVSAKQLLEAPLPLDEAAWGKAIEPLQDASWAVDGAVWWPAMKRFGELMNDAYGADLAVLRWWLDRLPPWR